ncbi:AT-hook motif nuclear-localized protein 17 [Linum perenne]
MSSIFSSKLQPHHHHHLPFLPHDSTPTPPPSSTSDGATIEVHRRPRGRPPGSKNKPKPPIIITHDALSSSDSPPMSPYILELPAGSDLIDSISRFSRRRNLGLCVLTGSGTVSNVTLRQPSTTAPGATVTFHGRFDILSVSGTFSPNPAAAPLPDSFTISLAGPQGQIVGGIVSGTLMAAGTVYIIAATFNNPSFHRLPAGGYDHDARSSGSGGGEGHMSSPAVSGEHVAARGGDSSGNLRNEVIWPPAAGGSGEIMWGEMRASRHVDSEMGWPPNGRQGSAAARSRSPPPPY